MIDLLETERDHVPPEGVYPIQPIVFWIGGETPSGGDYQVKVTRLGKTWRVSWVVRDAGAKLVGYHEVTRRSESAAIATAERVLVSVRRLVAAKEAA